MSTGETLELVRLFEKIQFFTSFICTAGFGILCFQKTETPELLLRLGEEVVVGVCQIS